MIATGLLDKGMTMIREGDFVRYDKKAWIVEWSWDKSAWVLEAYDGGDSTQIPMLSTTVKTRELIKDYPFSTDYKRLHELLSAGARIEGISWGEKMTFRMINDGKDFLIGGQIPATTEWFGEPETARWRNYMDYFDFCCDFRGISFVDPADLK